MTGRASGIHPMSLEHLIAVNDEIIALVRAGIPLEQGLANVGSDVPRTVGRITALLAEDLGRGQTLDAALAAHGQTFPPVYRAVIQAGLRSGRLASALESTALAARNLVELRRTMAMALAYPLLILWLAIGLGALFALKIAPTLMHGYRDLTGTDNEVMLMLVRAGEKAPYWAIPLLVLVPLAFLAWSYYSRNALFAQADWRVRLLFWFPGVRAMLRYARAAAFAEMTALLVEQRVPWHEAMSLAAESTGDPDLTQRVGRLASAAEQGRSNDAVLANDIELPPLLSWLIRAGGQQQALAPALTRAAENYRRRAVHRADLLRVALPILLTAVIGGGATLAYGLVVFWPWSQLLRNIH